MKTTNNKNIKNKYNEYKRSDARQLWDVYGKFSNEKIKAFDYCVDLCKKYNGVDLKIISYNTFAFSCGFTYTNDDGRKMFVYITKTQDQQTQIDE